MTHYQEHLHLTQLVKTERKITREVLLFIQKLDQSKYYAELGHSSLFDYLVFFQKYSEGSAQRRISAARLTKDFPEVDSKIQEGKLNLTQLSKLAIAVRQEQKMTGRKVSLESKKEIISKLENQNGFETERLLNQEFKFSSAPAEKLVPKGEDYQLTLKLSQAQHEKLKRAQGILSHVVHDGNYAALLELLCDKVIQKQDAPSRKKNSPAKDLEISVSDANDRRKPNAKTLVSELTRSATKPKAIPFARFIPSATRKYIFHKAQNCCEYVNAETKHRCGSQYQLQLDHKVPLARGGHSNPENLRLLCRTHNLSEARRWGLSTLQK